MLYKFVKHVFVHFLLLFCYCMLYKFVKHVFVHFFISKSSIIPSLSFFNAFFQFNLYFSILFSQVIFGKWAILFRTCPLPMPSFLFATVVVVVLLRPFRGMRAWKNSTETQQSDHAPRYGPEVKNGRICAKDGAPERLRCRTIQKEVTEGVRWRCKKNFPSVLSCIGKRTKEGWDRGSEVETVHSGRNGEGTVPPKKPKESGRRGSCEKDFVSKKSSGCVEAARPSFRF